MLTDNGAWHLQRKADGTWTPTQVGGAVAHLTLDATGLLWSEKHGESTQLIRRRFDANPSTLIGAANPQPGAPTVAVAVDPQDATLVRADGGGHVSAYAPETRTWSDASVNSKGQVRELPVAAGSVWAWLPDSRTLVPAPIRNGRSIRNGSTSWTGPRTDCCWHSTTAVSSWSAQTTPWTCWDSAARGVFGSPWDAVTHLAELGPWLVVATKEAGVLAYHRADHRWRKIADQQLLQIETGQVDGAGNPLAYFALDSTGTVTWLATADDAPALHPVGIPAGQAVKQLVPTQGDMLALTADQIGAAAPGTPPR